MAEHWPKKFFIKKNIMALTSTCNFVIGLTISLVTWAANGACLGVPSASPPLRVYVVPQLTPTQIYTRWAPLLENIGQQTKLCFELIVPISIPQFESDLNDGAPDFAYMNPYHAVMNWREHKYVPLIASSEPIFGVLSVSRENQIQNIQDLKGSKIAFPAPNAFAASLLIRATLTAEGVPYDAIYLKTHSNVYRSVIRGDVVAGGGIQSTLMSEPAELRAELRVLMETKRYTAHPFSANARVPTDVQKKVQEAFLKIGQGHEGRKLLKGAQLADPKIVTFELNYKPLEALKLENFLVRHAN